MTLAGNREHVKKRAHGCDSPADYADLACALLQDTLDGLISRSLEARVQALFDALDRKQTQKLDSKAMRQFVVRLQMCCSARMLVDRRCLLSQAHLTGFYGDDADWDMEFRGMCEHFDWSASEGP